MEQLSVSGPRLGLIFYPSILMLLRQAIGTHSWRAEEADQEFAQQQLGGVVVTVNSLLGMILAYFLQSPGGCRSQSLACSTHYTFSLVDSHLK